MKIDFINVVIGEFQNRFAQQYFLSVVQATRTCQKDKIIREILIDKNEIAIGRDSGNDLCIDNLAASSRHSRLFKGPDNTYAIEDLNSTNGTFVNGKQIMTQGLQNYDQVAIGKHTICITYQDDDAFSERKTSSISQSTYLLDPQERDRLTSQGKR
jgi:pSer/pThr/pTyr-binding forkhead associated (FHA) protein